jgi:hypothetical protein
MMGETMADEQWPPGDVSLPVSDAVDIRAFGWDLGRIGSGEHAGSFVLQTGPCGDHFALVLEPGASITCGEDGKMAAKGVTFVGRPIAHDQDCAGTSA